MSELYELNLSEVSEDEVTQWYNEMDENSRRRVDAMAHPGRRCASIAGDHLARKALAERNGKAPREIVICREENGKPFAAEGHFSISHSGERVVCAVSGHPVGVDVERIRPIRLRVAQRYFTEDEQKLLQEDASQFWRIWTGKEALCKLSGEGLAGIAHCDTLAPPASVILTTKLTEEYVITVAEEEFDNFKK